MISSDILLWLEFFAVTEYEQDKSGRINVYQDVTLYGRGLEHIPIPFGRIEGYFDVSNNELLTLHNAPTHVSKYFNCHNNFLRTLKYCPLEVGQYFDCHNNQIQTWKWHPRECYEFHGSENRLPAPSVNKYSLYKPC